MVTPELKQRCPIVTVRTIGPRLTSAQIVAALPQQCVPTSVATMSVAMNNNPTARAQQGELIQATAVAVAQAQPYLWSGKWEGESPFGDKLFPSQSEADLALAGHIVTHLRNTRALESHVAAIAEAVFDRSGLAQRDKWKTRHDYRLKTIARACAQHSSAPITTSFAPTVAAAGALASPPPIPLSSTSLMNLPHLLPAARVVQEVNQFIGFTHDWGGRPTLFRVDSEGRVHPCSRDEVRALLANRFVDTGGGCRKPLFPYWEASPYRWTVAQVVYDPSGRTTNAKGEAILNLWCGFARKPSPGSWKLMFQHLHKVVCSGNAQHLTYLLAWMAHLVQRPWEAPGVVVVLRSHREGTGKTTVLGWLSTMLGIHGLMLSDPTQLLGRFNTHLETISFVGLNELGWAGDKDASAKLKSIITDPTITIERKHGGVYSVANLLHIMATSNSDWVVPAGDRARRFFVLDVDPIRAGDHAYFDALHDEAQNGGIEALLEFLRHCKCGMVNLRAAPITDALREQQERSLPLQVQWALDLSDRAGSAGLAGAIIFGKTVLTRALYEDYLVFAASRRTRPLDPGPFGKWLTKIGLEDDRTSTNRQRILPLADEFAKLIRKSAGVHE